ncbi:MAG: CYTH domain-containing protein [Treponema sp.]|jgi:adenylate cyclase class IV|nr:CYTH domain-containing protein [Treponema sp.]
MEIELKARVADPEACRRRLESLGGKGAAFRKDDGYWFPVNPGAPLPSPSGLRVRREEKAGVQSVLVTWKTKERRGPLEVNDEREFALAGEAAAPGGETGPGERFEELLRALGMERRFRKRKEGWAWNIGGITAELMEVSGSVPSPGETGAPRPLGWFLELEIIPPGADAPGDAGTGEAQARLLALLEKAGPGTDALESRYYTELLAEAPGAIPG